MQSGNFKMDFQEVVELVPRTLCNMPSVDGNVEGQKLDNLMNLHPMESSKDHKSVLCD